MKFLPSRQPIRDVSPQPSDYPDKAIRSLPAFVQADFLSYELDPTIRWVMLTTRSSPIMARREFLTARLRKMSKLSDWCYRHISAATRPNG